MTGLYFYLKDEKKKFITFFAIAVVCRMFALWVYIPLVLLKEKRIRKILLYGVGLISLVIIPKLLMILMDITGPTGNAAENGVIAHSNLINRMLFCGNEAPLQLKIYHYFLWHSFSFGGFVGKKKL